MDNEAADATEANGVDKTDAADKASVAGKADQAVKSSVAGKANEASEASVTGKAIEANKLDEQMICKKADESDAAWVDMADANKSNDGKVNFCCTTTS